MADTKISGLPASTTPLAGTEVLPIVQSGTTKQVSVANLTAGRDIVINTLTVGLGSGQVATNTVVGSAALNSNTTGTLNAVFGQYSLVANTTGLSNSGFGWYTLGGNTTGSSNTAVGDRALFSNTTASNNTAVGYQALQANTTANNNTAVGYQAGYTNSTGTGNTFVGNLAGYFTTTNIVTAVGSGALYTNTTGNNDAFGFHALFANTTGNANGAFGGNVLAANTTGNYNTAFFGLQSNTTGSSNSAFGLQALQANTTASNNTAVGYQAGYSNTTGANNAFFGYQAGYSNTTGVSNTFNGLQAGYSNTTGTNNTIVGYQAGFYITTGTKNTIIGCYNGNFGGLDIRTASNYIVLSDGDGNPLIVSGPSFFSLNGINADGNLGGTPTTTTLSANLNDGVRINTPGGSYWNKAGNGIVIAFRNSGSTAGNISQSGTTTSYNGTSDYRLKKNVKPLIGALETVAKLKPCTFDWIYDNRSDNGFIAHELQEVLPNAVVGIKDAVREDGEIEPQGIDPRLIVATLTAAIQELKVEVDSLKQQLGAK